MQLKGYAPTDSLGPAAATGPRADSRASHTSSNCGSDNGSDSGTDSHSDLDDGAAASEYVPPDLLPIDAPDARDTESLDPLPAAEPSLNLAHSVLFSHGEAVRELAVRVRALEAQHEAISRPERLRALAEAMADCVDGLRETGQCCVPVRWDGWGLADAGEPVAAMGAMKVGDGAAQEEAEEAGAPSGAYGSAGASTAMAPVAGVGAGAGRGAGSGAPASGLQVVQSRWAEEREGEGGDAGRQGADVSAESNRQAGVTAVDAGARVAVVGERESGDSLSARAKQSSGIDDVLQAQDKATGSAAGAPYASANP